MDQFNDLLQQVEVLRQKMREVVQTSGNADAEIITATTTLDTQLEDYAHSLREKWQPTLRTF
jgi:uncharacterized membrane protein YgcG